MMQSPEAGNIVRGSGGVRKLRWRREGAGKRGGLRMIYYFVRYQPHEFWMLALYAKAKQENVPAHILRQLKEAFRSDMSKKLTGRAFARFEAERDIWQEILHGVREIK